MTFRFKRLRKKYAGSTTNREIPDDVLVRVLSLLTMKEAGRTSVLSKTWKHACSYLTTLNFDSRDIIDHVELGITELDVEEPKYLYWVNQVISSHKAPFIDEFRVRFDFASLNDNTRNNIDNWLRFAMDKRVKSLEMDFSVLFGGARPSRYTFPDTAWSSSCNSLTSLELACVNVTGQTLEGFLCNCVALEKLSVKYSASLVELTVAGPLLKLTTLSIYRCFSVKKLEISAPNLVSICYFGPRIDVQFKSTPKLSHVSIGHHYADDLARSFSDLSSYLSQIEFLGLSPFTEKMVMFPITDPVFPRLTKLDISFNLYLTNSPHFLWSLVKACPFLHYLKLQLLVNGMEKSRFGCGLEQFKVCPHYHLKIVEIVGLYGDRADLNIIKWLIKTSVSLEKMILDSRNVYQIGTPFEFEDTEEKRDARKHAKKIRKSLNPDTVLQIL